MRRDDLLPVRGHHRPPRAAARQATGAVVVVVTGEFDNTAVAVFEKATNAAIEGLRGRPLVVDLSGLDFLGSAAVAELVELHRRLGSQLRVVVGDSGRVRRPIEIAGLHNALSVYDTVERAGRSDGQGRPAAP